MFVTYQLPQHRRTGPRAYQTADFSPIGERYTDLQYRAVGAYGVVVSARDTQASSNPKPTASTFEEEEDAEPHSPHETDNNKVAIKKITLIDSAKFHLLVLRELRILCHLEHENIIDIRDMLLAPRADGDEWQIEPPIERSIFLIQTLMEFNLHTFLQQQRLSLEHVCCFVYQILRGLKFIHSAKVFHRDLKPNNILLNTRCELKICDFGQARLVVERQVQNLQQLTEYVVTRWYRAPEIMLNPCAYSQAVDIWAVGCIFGEMLCNRPLFPGSSSTNQVDKIIAVLGTPSQAELDGMDSSVSARAYIEALPRSVKQPWHNAFAVSGRGALDASITDLLDKLLAFSPLERITAADALQHDYVKLWHDPEDEPACHETIVFEPDIDNFSVQQLGKLLANEVDAFKKKRNMNDGSNRTTMPSRANKQLSLQENDDALSDDTDMRSTMI